MVYNALVVKFSIGILLAILIVIVGGFVYVNSRQKNQNQINTNAAPTIVLTLTPTIPLKNENANIPKDYKSYKTADFSLTHHPEMEVNEDENGLLAFVLVGPTQKSKTKLTDGINFTVNTGSYETQTFREFVESEFEKLKKSGASQITQGILSVSIGEKDGFEFRTGGIGDLRQIYFDVGNNKYVHVALMVVDPNDSGFELVVEQMLQSLTF